MRNPDNKKVLECSSRGDKRFSAFYAKITINDREQSIEKIYQNAKRGPDGLKAGKGRPFTALLCPFTGASLPPEDASDLYKGLWIIYLDRHPDLVQYATQFDEFSDMFRGKNTVNCQADVIEAYVKNKERLVSEVHSGHWYQNLKAHHAQKITSAAKPLVEAEFSSLEEEDFDEREQNIFHARVLVNELIDFLEKGEIEPSDISDEITHLVSAMQAKLQSPECPENN